MLNFASIRYQIVTLTLNKVTDPCTEKNMCTSLHAQQSKQQIMRNFDFDYEQNDPKTTHP